MVEGRLHESTGLIFSCRVTPIRACYFPRTAGVGFFGKNGILRRRYLVRLAAVSAGKHLPLYCCRTGVSAFAWR